MVGHTSSVVAAAANPKLFYPPKKLLAARNKQLQEMQAAAAANEGPGQAAEDQEAAAGDDEFECSGAMVMACGSNDKTLTIWCSELALPLMHCRQVRLGDSAMSHGVWSLVQSCCRCCCCSTTKCAAAAEPGASVADRAASGLQATWG